MRKRYKVYAGIEDWFSIYQEGHDVPCVIIGENSYSSDLVHKVCDIMNESDLYYYDISHNLWNNGIIEVKKDYDEFMAAQDKETNTNVTKSETE